MPISQYLSRLPHWTQSALREQAAALIAQASRLHGMTTDLIEDHRAILALSEELLTLARREPRPSAEELTQMRSKLGTRAAQHLRDEEEMIIRPLLASGRIDELPAAKAAIAAIRESRAHYSNHVGKWNPAAIKADWDGYVAALVAMIDYLKPVLVHEERDLYWPALRLLGQPVPTLRR